MSGNNFINKGIEAIKIAVEADDKGEYEKALRNYVYGTQHLVKGAQYEKNKKLKQTLNEKANKYIERAEYLKANMDKMLMNKTEKAGNVGDDKDEADDEKTKMEKSLSSAIVIEKPNIKWSDVAGLENAKNMLKEAVILPIKFPQLFTGNRKPWKGILLYGPPGTGKSFLAKAVATEANNSTFFSVSSSDLVSKYLGESEKLVRALFESARKSSPAIIFIDEIDSLCGNRSDGENDSTRRIKTEFLVQMQGVGKSNDSVLVLGATNTPWELDPAIRRRFEKRIYIPLPDLEAREAMFKNFVGKTPNNLCLGDLKKLAEETDGYSGSDIDSLNRDALYEPVRTIMHSKYFKKLIDPKTNEDYFVPCSMADEKAEKKNVMDLPEGKIRPAVLRLIDFMHVLPNSTCSVSEEDIARHTRWTEEFGIEG